MAQQTQSPKSSLVGQSICTSYSQDQSQSLYYSQDKSQSVKHLLECLPLSQESERPLLATLADIADALAIDDLSFSHFATAISELSSQEVSTRRSSLHMRHARDELSMHLAIAQHEEMLIKRWLEVLQAEPNAQDGTSALEKRKQALHAKAMEYKRETDSLKQQLPQDPPCTISELSAFQKQLKDKENTLAEKRRKVEAFQGLPANIELARHELRIARDEQMKLIQLRERLLDRMAVGMS
ncbi:uncharacterized protein LAESUDRAFT_696530 [Laetiporus sulphureus 93-53]|uniref:Uncharacterized protein n=1 Tax=Laetiporus sulphureus 93-53 TaxID=1314785 RepID=A0A165FJP4_9APHY|nr:uncharacterized protein LAESUDRAFT_696530 [Laetiporus sulphureus 93-53]KZT09074.1 hypothetical protein LAESUDRAFT_696530 [Laetiporus sulphureus 93-53]